MCKANWISVKDRLPDEGKYVLVAYSSGGVFVGSLIGNGVWALGTQRLNAVSHWAELPEPPMKGEG